MTRWAYLPWVTLGTLRVAGLEFETLEPPWRNNMIGESCIPAATYRITLGNFKGRYSNYEVHDVPGRTNIEIHRGNFVTDTHGCPLIGESLTVKTATRYAYLADSELAFDRFMEAMAWVPEAELIIAENCITTKPKE